MQGKYFLLVLIVTYSQNIASSHILTSTYGDMSLPACNRMLMSAMIYSLCPTSVDYSSEYQSSIEQEIDVIQRENREKIIQKCCSRPCTITELLAMC